MKHSRGFAVSTIIYGIAAIAAVSGTLYVVHSYNSAMEENASLKADKATLTEANSGLIENNTQLILEKAELDKILAIRQTQRNVQADLDRKVDDALARLYSSDQSARDWGSTPVPDSVLRSLHNDAKGDLGNEARKSLPTTEPVAPTNSPRLAF